MTWTDERVESLKKTVGRGTVGKARSPPSLAASPAMRDRQGAPPRPLGRAKSHLRPRRPRKARAHTHLMRVFAPLHSRKYRARACL